MSFGDKNFTYGPRIVKDGLVFYVDAANPKSYVSGNTTCNDLIGVNDGTLLNGTTFDEEHNGSFSFDGSDDYISLSTYGAGVSQTDITIDCWFNLSGNGDGGWSGIYCDLSPVGQRDRFLIKDGRTEFEYIMVGLGVTDFFPYTLSLNVWYNITITKDSVSGTTLYLNGVNFFTEPSETGIIKGVPTGPATNKFPSMVLGVGARIGPSAIYELNGKISNFKSYNRALSQIEIIQNYNSLKGRFGL